MINIDLIKEVVVKNKILNDSYKAFSKYQNVEDLIKHLETENIISQDNLYILISEQIEIPYFNILHQMIDLKLFKLFKVSLIRENLFIPLFKIDNNIAVIFSNPLDIYLIDELKKLSNLNIIPYLGNKNEIVEIINSTFQLTENINSIIEEIFNEEDISTLYKQEFNKIDLSVETSPIVKLVDLIIKQALILRASDIHIEPEETEIKIRFRIDGILYKKMSIPINVKDNLVSRIKVIAGMDISEKRLPQDGRIIVHSNNQEIDIRVATSSTIKGEKIVMRLLQKNNLIKEIERLGIDEHNNRILNKMLSNKNGIIIVSGPTGSGKTTTLYTILQNLNSENNNIITIEDPVEYVLDNVNQMQVNAKIGLTFASGLRAILRQDPDIILLGEIRDSDTAHITVRSALTGHLVLTTLHTNSAVESISRLLDMGIESYLITSSIIGIVSQRLLKKLCNECKQPIELTEEMKNSISLTTIPKGFNKIVYKKTGCVKCNYTGYKGRTGVFEILQLNDNLKEIIIDLSKIIKLEEYAIKNGMKKLKDAAIEKFLSGITDIDELITNVINN